MTAAYELLVAQLEEASGVPWLISAIGSHFMPCKPSFHRWQAWSWLNLDMRKPSISNKFAAALLLKLTAWFFSDDFHSALYCSKTHRESLSRAFLVAPLRKLYRRRWRNWERGPFCWSLISERVMTKSCSNACAQSKHGSAPKTAKPLPALLTALLSSCYPLSRFNGGVTE